MQQQEGKCTEILHPVNSDDSSPSHQLVRSWCAANRHLALFYQVARTFTISLTFGVVLSSCKNVYDKPDIWRCFIMLQERLR